MEGRRAKTCSPSVAGGDAQRGRCTWNLEAAGRTRALMLQETRVAEEEWHAVDRRAALLDYHVYRVTGGTYRGRWAAQQLQSHTEQKLLHYKSKSDKSGNGPNIAGTHARWDTGICRDTASPVFLTNRTRAQNFSDTSSEGPQDETSTRSTCTASM